ncbi:MAG TPA: type II CAAX endopeptidase family protein [Chloroflexota bacterium]|nr:type II CAAX endopeptidase family protein [Chloroflexota bacterium]
MSSTNIDRRQTDVLPPRVAMAPTPRRAPRPSIAAAAPQGFIKRHPLLMFFAIAFAISLVGILLVVGLGDVQGGVAPATDPRFLLMMLAWLAGPSVASIVMTGLVSGRSGYRNLLGRLTTWRVGAGWYALALLLAPLVSVGLSYALSAFSPEFLPSIVTSTDPSRVIVMGVSYGLLGGGFLEELGWTGFAVPRFRRRYGVLGAGLIMGLLWGAYHFSVIYWSGNPAGALALGLVLPAQLFAWLPPFRVVMVWMYDHTHSLLLAMLMHASATASMLILQPFGISGVMLLAYVLGLGVVYWTLVGVVGVATRGRFAAAPFGPTNA